MAKSRLLLQKILEQIPDVEKAYFQPPNGLQMKYPCIVYDREGAVTDYADNLPYNYTYRYTVTVISDDPDTAITRRIAQLPLCTFNRSFPAGNLNHDVFTLYF